MLNKDKNPSMLLKEYNDLQATIKQKIKESIEIQAQIKQLENEAKALKILINIANKPHQEKPQTTNANTKQEAPHTYDELKPLFKSPHKAKEAATEFSKKELTEIFKQFYKFEPKATQSKNDIAYNIFEYIRNKDVATAYENIVV